MYIDQISDILAILIKNDSILNGNVTELARKTGLNQPTLNRLLNKKIKSPRDETLQPICDYFGITQAQLKGIEPIKNQIGETPNLYNVKRPVTPKNKVPLIIWETASKWCDNNNERDENDIIEWLPNPGRGGKYTYAIRVHGDSMTSRIPGSKTYPEGCIIYIDPEKRYENLSRVIAKFKDTGEVTFKCYKYDCGRHWLMPLNPDYPPIEITDNVIICGVVVGKYEED